MAPSRVAFSSWLYLIKFCALFSHLSSPSISITDTVSYLISYLAPLYFHAHGRLTFICLGTDVTVLSAELLVTFSAFFDCCPYSRTNERLCTLSAFSYLYAPTEARWSPDMNARMAKNSTIGALKLTRSWLVQAFCRKKKDDPALGFENATQRRNTDSGSEQVLILPSVSTSCHLVS